MGVRNGFGRRWLYRADARAHVGGPTPPGHPVFAARRVLPCPATHAQARHWYGGAFGPCIASLLRRAYVWELDGGTRRGGAPVAPAEICLALVGNPVQVTLQAGKAIRCGGFVFPAEEMKGRGQGCGQPIPGSL